MIEDSLLHAQSLEQAQLFHFVEEPLTSLGTAGVNENLFHNPLHKKKPLTFSALYEVKKPNMADKTKILKADWTILHRLVTAYEAGRQVNMQDIYCNK